MSAESTGLLQILSPLRRRLQWRDSLKFSWLALGAGLGITGILLIAGRFYPLLFQNQLLLIGLGITAFLWILGQIYAWLKPIGWQRLAQLGDYYLKLDERLITALDLVEGRLETSPSMGQAQLNDTFHRARQISIPQAIPLTRANKFWQITGLLLLTSVAVTALYLSPNPQEILLEEQAAVNELLEEEIAQLEEIQSELLADADPLAAAEIEELSDTLAELIDKLEAAKAESSPESALAALSEAEETLTQLDQERLAQEESLESLAESLAESDLDSVQQAAQALQDGNYQQAAEALAQAGANPPSSQNEANAMANNLSQAASGVASQNPELAQSLQQAANALQSGNTQAAQEALEQAAQQMSQAGGQQQALEQMEQALSNIQQARQELAQGQGQGQGQGQNSGRAEALQQGQGQGGQDGQGQGGPGNGSGRGDPGQANDGLFSAQGTNGIISTDNGANQNRLEDYNSIYAPDHIGGEGGEFVVPDPQNPDDGGIDIGETAPNPNREAGESAVPYTEVYYQYQQQAGTALEGDYIPLGMKDYIRQYFGALEPGSQ